MHESEDARKAREAAEKAEQSVNEAWSRGTKFTQRQLQHEFNKADKGFGIKGNWNKVNAAKFEQAIRDFKLGGGH